MIPGLLLGVNEDINSYNNNMTKRISKEPYLPGLPDKYATLESFENIA
jgi:hypothetical protein